MSETKGAETVQGPVLVTM